MRFRCCLGMIWSVSMFSRCSGATTPRCWRIGSMASAPVLPRTDIDEAAGHRSGGRGCRADEMRAAVAPLAAFEVAVAGGSAALLGRKNVRIHAQAHRASRLPPLCAGFFEDAVEAFFF